MYLQQREPGMQDFMYAVKEKIVEDHNVIDEAIRDEAEGYTVFSIPVGVVYRPNEAKVRNLKTKDYLGKAKLVATSDRTNAFTGFTGSEIKKSTTRQEVKDDRPSDNISFAATNLVQPGLRSRRQQSEPPGDRNVFPPTPPPENERAMSRAASVRSGNNGMRPPLAKLNIQTQENGRYEKAMSPPDGRPQLNRSATSTRSFSRDRSLARRPTLRGDEEPQSSISSAGAAYPSDLYDMYQQRPGSTQPPRQYQPYQPSRQPRRMMEQPDDPPSDYDDGSVDEGDFEMLPAVRRPGTSQSVRSRSRRPAQGGGGGGDVSKIRVKAFAADDVRYILIGVAITYPDFLDKVRDKFGLEGRRFKVKMRDEDMPDGEKITMGDQDDLDMAIMTSKSQARRERQEVGKLDVSHTLHSHTSEYTY